MCSNAIIKKKNRKGRGGGVEGEGGGGEGKGEKGEGVVKVVLIPSPSEWSRVFPPT